MNNTTQDKGPRILVETVLSDDSDEIVTIDEQIDDVTDTVHLSDNHDRQNLYRLSNFIGYPVTTLTKHILDNIGVQTDAALVQLTHINPGVLYWLILDHPANRLLHDTYPPGRIRLGPRNT